MTSSTSEVAVCCCSELGQIVGARLNFVEQARVLDGDNRLVGEGFEQFDVPFGEGTDLIAGDENRSDRCAIAQHRHRKDASPSARLGEVTRVLQISQHVLDLDDLAREDRPPRSLIGLRWPRIHALQDCDRLRRIIVMSDEVHQLAVEPVHRAHARPAKAHRVGDDGIEHRLNIGLRSADHSQDFIRCRLLLERLA